jgi:hypothetical protein
VYYILVWPQLISTGFAAAMPTPGKCIEAPMKYAFGTLSLIGTYMGLFVRFYIRNYSIRELNSPKRNANGSAKGENGSGPVAKEPQRG